MNIIFEGRADENKTIERKLQCQQLIDVSKYERTDKGDYVVPEFVDAMDYADCQIETWIESIGRHYETGRILASTTNRFYMNTAFECLFLR